ncbi:MAG: CBS domain-containing protein [Anaerolineae bacterium]|nr:CBS domain-containing protein [Anaerolineae bacterium]MCB9130246.1 CBS domain-containing protein [Anaerolineales bacterium]MCB0229841.1 CBS domain-containing protein [Anaerolineae bacterium]MCB0235748.1 CBS domain-containing protein [Anaerolineae bacterium]MCB0239769.1 CBS domain-containing protein [Anaerolineae bacterium]
MNTVAETMTTDVLSVDPQNSVATAIRLMRTGQLRRLPVVEDGKLVGIVTSGDVRRITGMSSVVRDPSGDNFLWQHIPVANVMTYEVVTTSPDMLIADAARLMIEHKIGGLPVVDRGRLVGILTTSDLLAALIDCEQSIEPLVALT